MKACRKIVVLLALSIIMCCISFAYAVDDTAELVKTLKDKSGKVRQSAAGQLIKMGWKPANESERIDFLIAITKFSELEKMGAVAVEPLINVLDDDSGMVRVSVALALGRLKDARAIEPLINGMNNKKNSGYMKGNFIKSLKKLTKQDFGDDHAKWLDWWTKNKESFVVGK